MAEQVTWNSTTKAVSFTGTPDTVDGLGIVTYSRYAQAPIADIENPGDVKVEFTPAE